MAFVGDLFFPQMDATPTEWVDFDQFLDLPAGYEEVSPSDTTISPQDLALPYADDQSFMFTPSPSRAPQTNWTGATNYHLPQEDVMGYSMDGGYMPDPAAPLFDDASFSGYNPYDSSMAFRSLVEAQAAADPRVASIKEKRREAAIALHLQRLCDATALDLDMSSDSNTSFSSPSWSDYMRESTSPQPARPSRENTSAPEASPPGAMEMILDLNMNATANVPKKQKPRSQAQKENYIKARKYGACEKHKKQHKRCNCLEKAAAIAGVTDVPMNAAFQERPRQPMLHAPVLPEARYSGAVGHDPLLSSPQALPTVKAIRKPASTSAGHDPSMRLPVETPSTAGCLQTAKVPKSTLPAQNIATSCSKNTPPGHDTVLVSGKPTSKTSSGHDIILVTGKTVAKNISPGHDRVVGSGNQHFQNSSGHDVVLNSGKSAQQSTSSGHDIVLRDETKSSSSPTSRSNRVSRGKSSFRWRVSTLASIGGLTTSLANYNGCRPTHQPLARSVILHWMYVPGSLGHLVPWKMLLSLRQTYQVHFKNRFQWLLPEHQGSANLHWDLETLEL
ncbi:uncharacterized protein N7511_008080 [Penicillium nucicola]|uniref:uncharacterized protein n=1 Tax=Penicillium nucicola TaxID=1850975 RepID=UPI002545B7B5|nr:uncharacterized protein N7511_008080 [Penicillium nucicola]KAJ5753927.1 hypothetical protein N7511_008080 [Penicillium nucicola]